MSNVSIPSLQDTDWDTDPYTSLDKAMAFAYATDHSQTNTYLGNVFSMSYVFQQHPNDPEEVAVEMELGLTKYLGRIFKDARISVSVEDNDDELGGMMDMYINGEVDSEDDEGNITTIPLNYSLGMEDSKLVSILKLVNE